MDIPDMGNYEKILKCLLANYSLKKVLNLRIIR